MAKEHSGYCGHCRREVPKNHAVCVCGARWGTKIAQTRTGTFITGVWHLLFGGLILWFLNRMSHGDFSGEVMLFGVILGLPALVFSLALLGKGAGIILASPFGRYAWWK